jgi:hypothetical protein
VLLLIFNLKEDKTTISFCFTSGTHTICSDEPCHDGERKTFEVMLKTLLLGTIAATLYQGNKQ